MEKDPIITIAKYKSNNYCTLIFNKVAISWLGCRNVCVNFINATQFKISKPTIDSNNVRKIHHRTNILNVTTDEYFIGTYNLYRVNEDEFIATRNDSN